jgi:uncharacterized repeat protein (TIGR01451 family)
MVNEGFEVFDKSTGNVVQAARSIVSIWAGSGQQACTNGGFGDPVVLFDQLANRWVITEFASPTGGTPITDECIAVSTTADATGSYNRYDFHLGTDFFDYPHLSVWPDAYYMSMNVFNSGGSAKLGVEPFAFDRAAMLAGTSATFVAFRNNTAYFCPNCDYMLPADVDGTNPPPAGSDGPFLQAGSTDTTHWHLWHFHPDFATPANSTFTLGTTLTPAAYTVLCPGFNRSCVPEQGGENVDALGDRLMFRLSYRHFDDGHEALVGNMTVSSTNVAGIRWFEINNVTSGTASFVQQSTYQPDTTWRWMGSAAMDHSGDLAVGFDASSAAIHPQVRYAGRLAGDPINTLAQGETHLFDGAGSQQSTSSRWGDYSDITVDPVDDCTFWYTNEYYSTTSSFNWRTRIGSFKFPNCVTTGGTLAGTVTDSSTDSPIDGAHVNVSNGASATTNASGHYEVTLAPGTYSATYSKGGYASQTFNNLVINDGETTTQDAALTPSADLSITKTADDDSVNSGDSMDFRVTLTNAGSPTATGVVLTDNLPSGQDVDWTLAGDSDSGWSVTGSPPNQQLVAPGTVAGNASTMAHVTSATTGNSAGTYHNTASFTSDNAGSGTADATIAVSTHYTITTDPGHTIVPGTTDIGNHCDDCVTNVNFPFPVSIYGHPYTTASASSNGNLQFSTANTAFSNTCLPDTSMGTMFAPYWDDLYTVNSGFGIYSLTSGTAPEGARFVTGISIFAHSDS